MSDEPRSHELDPPPQAQTESVPRAEGDLRYESRLRIVERVHGDVQPAGVGWRTTAPDLAAPKEVWWERVLKDGHDSQIVEELILGPDEPEPGGGWTRTGHGMWLQRVLRPSTDEEEDVDEDSDEDYAGNGPSRGPSSGVLRPRTGNSLRALVTISLTTAIIVVVLIAVITDVPTESFTAYVAPLLALAGTALGFWFGSEQRS